MKFICNTEFFEGKRLFYGGNSYDLNEEAAEKLIALDKKKPLGALSYFDPADDDADKFVKANKGKVKGGKKADPADDDADEVEDITPQPTREELFAKAQELGLDVPKNISTAKLIAAIEEASKE